MRIQTSRHFLARLARRRNARTLATLASLPLLLGSAKAANIENDFVPPNSGGNLLLATNWSLQTLPTVTNDAVFLANASTGNRGVSNGSLTFGSLNSLATVAITIQTNSSAATNSTLTFGGSGNLGNGITGFATDLFYVATGGTFNIAGPNASTGTGTVSVALGQTGTFNVAGTSTINAVISGGFGLTKTGAGTLNLNAANTYTGTTTINRGALVLGFAAATAANGTSAASNIIASGNALALGGGTLSLVGPTTGTVTNGQTFGGTTLNAGSSNITAYSGTSATANANDTVNLALGGITRNTGGTVNFILPTTGSVTTTTANAATTILGGWATVGSSGWAVSAGNGTTAGAISALSSYYTTTTGGSTAGNYTGQNVDVTTSNVNASGTGVLSGVVTLNSIRFNTSTNYTFQFAPGTTNTISSGGILFGSGNTSGTASSLTGGTITSGTSDLVITSYATTTPTIFSAINGNISLTKAGTGSVSIASALSFTGNVYVNSGSLTLGGVLSTPGTVYVNSGGTLSLNNNITNTYTGQTIVAPGGQLILDSKSTPGSLGGSATGSETVIQNGGFFRTADANLTIAEPFIVAGAGAGGNNAGAIQSYNNSPTFSGTIQLASSAVLSTRPAVANKSTTFSNIISDQTSGANNDLGLLRINNIAAATTDRIVLSGQSSYGGNTYITDGAVTSAATLFNVNLQGGDNRLPTTTVVTLGGVTPALGGFGNNVGVAGGAGRLELGTGSVAVKQTVAGLATAGTSTLNAVVGGATATSTLTVNNTANYAFGGLLGGTGTSNNNLALTKSSAGTLMLSGANTYVGGTTVTGGTLTAASNAALGDANAANGVALTPVSGTATLNFTSAAPAIASLASSGAGTSNVVLGGTTTATTLTIGGTGNLSSAFAGTISDNAASNAAAVGNLVKAGTGTLTLGGNNTYTGTTTISGGTLLVNGTASNTSSVTVNNSGSVLGGAGTINNTVTVNSGGTIAPGTVATTGTAGELKTGALTLAANSTFAADILSQTSFDLLTSTGVVSLAGLFTPTVADGQTFTDGSTLTLTTGSSLGGEFSNFGTGASFTSNGYTFTADYTANSFGLDISITPVPEPTTWAAGILMLGALGYSQRRQVRRWLGFARLAHSA